MAKTPYTMPLLCGRCLCNLNATRRGIHVVALHGDQRTVCGPCADELRDRHGYVLIATAKAGSITVKIEV